MCNTQLTKITLLALTIWFSNCSKSVKTFSEIHLLHIPLHKGWYRGHALAELRGHPEPVISSELQVLLLR